MSIALRGAEPGDLGFVLSNMRSLAAAEGRPGAVTVTVRRLEEMLFGGAPRARCLIVERDAEAVGHAWIEERYSTFTGHKALYLEDLVIVESVRGQGVGRRAMGLLAALARREGFESMAWSVVDENREVFRFYERLGGRPTGSTPFRLEGAAYEALAREGRE